MSKNEEYDYEDGNDDEWKDFEESMPRPGTVRVRPRRDWRDVERFREAREMKKFMNNESWFDELDYPEKSS